MGSRRSFTTPPSQTPTLHLDSLQHSRYDQHVHQGDRTGHPGRCWRAGAERLQLRGQRPDANYGQHLLHAGAHGRRFHGYMPMPSNGTGPYSTGSMAGSGMGGGSATATNTPMYTGAASAQKAAGGVAGLGLALIGLL